MTGKNLAPIVVSVYHRLDCLKRCVESLQGNPEAKDTEIWIVSDAAAKPEHEPIVLKVREYILSIRGFKAVHPVFHEKNKGAGYSVTQTINELYSRFGKLIFMEDDIVAAPDYLKYLNDGLEFYQDDKRVFAICAFKYPFKIPTTYGHSFFLMHQYSPWGFASWADRRDDEASRAYNRFEELQTDDPELFRTLLKEKPGFMKLLKDDSEGKVVAWDARNEYYIMRKQLVCAFPAVSRSQNWGFDLRSDHCKFLCGSVIPKLATVQTEHVRFEAYESVYGPSAELAKLFVRANRTHHPLWVRIADNLRWFGLRRTISFYLLRARQKMGLAE